MNKKIVAFLSLFIGIGLTGCATNDELFAKYDKTCDPPKVKIVKKVVEKEVIKEVVRQVSASDGLHWEPAVYFGFDQDALEGIEAERLNKNIQILKKYPTTKVNVQSFTDQKGSASYNKGLAKRREAMVVDYLQAMEIADNRIIVSPLGEELPILGESVKERQINRRVELMLLDQNGRPMALKIKPEESTFNPPTPIR